MDLRKLMVDSLRIAQDHGFSQDRVTLPIEIALMHSELSEALEEDRNGKPLLYTEGTSPKPEGVAAEFADVVIRIAQCCEGRGIPLIEAIEKKQAYNETRPFMHGGKRY